VKCLRLAACAPTQAPALPPGLDTWMRTMGAQLNAAIFEDEGDGGDEEWADVEEPDDTEMGGDPDAFEVQLKEMQEASDAELAQALADSEVPAGIVMPGEIGDDTPWGSHGFQTEADYEVWRKLRKSALGVRPRG
jgi:hypothetical protein